MFNGEKIMSKIVAKHSGGSRGPIEKYKLDDGRVLTHDEAVQACLNGEIEGVATFTTRDGGVGIRSDRGQYGYSIEELPEF